MPRHLRLGEMLLGIQGLAISRGLFSGADDDIGARVREMSETLDGMASTDLEALERLSITVTGHDTRAGYRAWAASYDEGTLPLVDVEQPVLLELLSGFQPGDAVDVGCGTGRVLGLLAELGYTVTGIDQSPEMVTLAGLRVPTASLHTATLGDGVALPVGDGTADLVTCALVLTHLRVLDAAMADLARVVRPGGHVVITDMHPLAVLLDGQAVFSDGDASSAFIRNHVHLHSDYLRAFQRAGLQVVSCIEPVVTPGRGPLLGLGAQVRPQAAEAAYLGLPFVLVWDLVRPAA